MSLWISLKEDAMNNILTRLSVGLALSAAFLSPVSIHAAQNDAMSRAEARQMQEQFTPQAQYRLSEREARAAYQDAMRDCQQMDKTKRAGCMRAAREHMRQDLADARQKMHGASSYGSSGTRGSTGSGSDTHSR
jgi:uncharacterized paraquat-inducible protein A